ncbi:beta strand repeat-containing protein [Egbenema bharatensis]|uniref:beta strand repeat-containing protein n=1 Tax=Egbenema bharatensis TaxID=3463334 RepID=UPI003A8783F8
MQTWRDRISSFGFVGALTIAGFGLWQTTLPLQTIAQPIPDETLGNERSQVFQAGETLFGIDGGATRGTNLFHSFQDFNVDNGNAVYFINPAGIENILSRVTGNNPSNILGTLGVFGGDANLFFMNPNGIVFGPNARLDVQGSFIATTADAIGFGNQGTFSAIDPQAPPLLTVNPSAFFFNQISPNALVNQSQVPVGTSPNGSNLFGLRVPDGESLLFVGGDIRLEGGGLVAQGGRVELGGLVEPGRIGLDGTNAGLRLIFPEGTNRSNVSLTNDARVGVRGTGGGNIVVYADRLDAVDGGRLVAGTEGDSNAGDLFIDANQVNLSGIGASDIQSGFYNTQAGFSGDSGNAGTITIETGTLNAGEGSLISALTFADGNAGTVNITARESVSFNGGDLFTAVQTGAIGNAGNININAGSVSITNRSQFDTSTLGQGNAGSINITARDGLLLDNAILFSEVGTAGIGDGGDIIINAGSVTLNNSRFISSTLGQGNAGSINITARDAVIFDNAILFSDGEATGIGDGGDIIINAGSVSFKNGSQLVSSTLGQGNAGNTNVTASGAVTLDNASFFSRVREDAIGNSGNITINAGALALVNGAQLINNVLGQGNAGNVRLNVLDTVTLNRGSVFSDVTAGAIGNSGDININAESVLLTNDSRLRASNSGQGDAGNVTVTVRDSISLLDQAFITSNIIGQGNAGDVRLNAGNRISLIGETATIITGIGTDGIGNPGNIIITTGSLSVTDQAQLAASALGQGNGGSIQITARENVLFARRGNATTSTVATAQGNAGDITIRAGSLTLTDDAGLGANPRGQGNAGNIILTVDDTITLSNRSFVSTFVGTDAVGNGGDIILSTGSLLVGNESGFGTFTAGQGNAGNIEITARDVVSFTGRLAAANTAAFANAIGNGGDITITTGSLLINGGQLTTATSGQGNAGNVTVNVRENISITNGGNIFSSTTSTAIGDAGDIQLTGNNIRVLRGGLLATATAGQGRAGNVVIEATDRVLFNEAGSDAITGVLSSVASTGIGRGGDITISARSVSALNGTQFGAITSGQGDAGNITINATDTVTFSGRSRQFFSGAFSTVQDNARGDAQTIRINTGTLSVMDGARVSASTLARGNAGNLIINARDAVIVDGTTTEGFSTGLFTSTSENAIGSGGTIRINTSQFRVSNGAVVNAQTQNRSRGGNIEVNANTAELTDGGQLITTTSSSGQAGNITINADRIRLSGADSTFAQRIEEFGRGQTANEGNGESGLFANTRIDATGAGGRIRLNTTNLQLTDRARISAQSEGSGSAGGITINARGNVSLSDRAIISTQSQGENAPAGDIQITVGNTFSATDSDITTSAANASGGNITLQASDIRLFGDSDILTNSAIDGGNITLRANSILAFGDSDIIAAAGERGGNITLDTPVFFGSGFTPDSANADPDTLDGNDRVDINASGQISSGNISIPDTSFVQDSLADLPESAIDTESLIASSCVVRSQETEGRFIITGRGGLPERPGEGGRSVYATGEVRSIPETSQTAWQMGDPIVEPQGLYQLEDGRMVLSRECD